MCSASNGVPAKNTIVGTFTLTISSANVAPSTSALIGWTCTTLSLCSPGSARLRPRQMPFCKLNLYLRRKRRPRVRRSLEVITQTPRRNISLNRHTTTHRRTILAMRILVTHTTGIRRANAAPVMALRLAHLAAAPSHRRLLGRLRANPSRLRRNHIRRLPSLPRRIVVDFATDLRDHVSLSCVVRQSTGENHMDYVVKHNVTKPAWLVGTEDNGQFTVIQTFPNQAAAEGYVADLEARDEQEAELQAVRDKRRDAIKAEGFAKAAGTAPAAPTGTATTLKAEPGAFGTAEGNPRPPRRAG